MSDSRVTIPEALDLALRVHKAGQLDKAEALYRNILKADPRQPDALHFLGVLAFQVGQKDEAVELIRKSLEVVPDHPDALNNLGNVLKECGRLEDAAGTYRRLIAIAPQHAEAYNNLGVTLKLAGRLDEAAEALSQAVALQPDFADAHHNLGNVRNRQKNYPAAVASWKRALELEPGHAEAVRNLGSTLFRSGQEGEAVALFEDCLRLDPRNPIARHMLAAYTGKDVPDRASDTFVREIFDGMADSFDSHLGELEYRAPELVARAVMAAAGSRTDLAILDAGCGTGLCGPLLKPVSATLHGIDLSPAMLQRAAARGAYDHLDVAEITAFLKAHPGAYDGIVAADTFNYFGRLEPLFRDAAAALRPGGWLVFTLEAGGEAAAGDFILPPHGRYVHAQDYVKRALAQAGFASPRFEAVTLRKEHGDPVGGWVITAAMGNSEISSRLLRCAP